MSSTTLSARNTNQWNLASIVNRCSPTCLFSLVIAFIVLMFATPVQADCLSTSCHMEIRQGASQHPATAEQCSSCHLSSKVEHPGSPGAEFTLAAKVGDLCFRCHTESDYQPAYAHGPVAVGACTTCHTPHGNGLPALLRKKMPALCTDCHQDIALGLQQAATIHSAITQQLCTACHLPHGGPHPVLLRSDRKKLCFSCHEDIQRRATAANPHAPLDTEKGCSSCHRTHYSEFANLLNRPSQELCYSCHGKDNSGRQKLRDITTEIQGKTYLHQPLAQEGCTGCHDPHGSDFANLLANKYPATFYAPYRRTTYGFCFTCHDPLAIETPYTTTTTGFRNGDRNLHYLHVDKASKGRSCRACHNAHASNSPSLITATGARFGSWNIPIRFSQTKNGGRCVPGCHRPFSYDRLTPEDYSTDGKTSEKTD